MTPIEVLSEQIQLLTTRFVMVFDCVEFVHDFNAVLQVGVDSSVVLLQKVVMQLDAHRLLLCQLYLRPDIPDLLLEIAIVFEEPLAQAPMHLPPLGHFVTYQRRVYPFGNIQPLLALVFFFVNLQPRFVLGLFDLVSYGISQVFLQPAEFEVHLVLQLHLHIVAGQVDIVGGHLIILPQLLFQPPLLALLPLLLDFDIRVHRNFVVVVHVVHQVDIGFYLLLGLMRAKLDDV